MSADNNPYTLCVIVPAFNEVAVLREFHLRLSAVLNGLPALSEILYVDDGSLDNTLSVMKELQKQDARVSVISLSRNFGKEIALAAGIDHAHADAVIVIDADLQDPPELIPELVARWRAGYDVAYARRTARQGETVLKQLTASWFYKFMHGLSRVRVPTDTGDYRLLSRRAIESLRQLREQHRFTKGLFAWIGYRQIDVPYRRDPRFAGETKWNYWKLWNFALEGITSFSIAPLKAATYVGLLVAGSAFLFAFLILVKTLLFGDIIRGYPTIMVTLLFLGGTQLIAIGVLGEYVGRMFNETKNRPLYFIDEHRKAPAVPLRHTETAPSLTASEVC